MTLRVSRRLDGVQRTLIRRMFDAAPPGTINLGLGQPDLPTPAPIAEAGIRAIREGRTGYTPTAGDPELRAAIAARYGGTADGPDGVVVTVGTQQALFVSCLALLDPGDELLVPDPGYPAYATVARMVGAGSRSYPLRPERSFRIDPVDVLDRITARTRAVVLCAPSNPTGAIHRRDDLARLIPELAGRGVAWISDEVYAGYCWDGRPATPRDVDPGGGLTVAGLSKDAAMTGWRIGWVVGSAEILGPVTAAHQHLVTCAPSISQRAAVAALGPEGRRAREEMRSRFAARRDRMASRLEEVPGLRWSLPDGGFYFFVRCPGHDDSHALALRILRERGVLTIPGVAFGPGGEGWLRVSFAASEEDIDRGVRAIGEVIASGG